MQLTFPSSIERHLLIIGKLIFAVYWTLTDTRRGSEKIKFILIFIILPSSSHLRYLLVNDPYYLPVRWIFKKHSTNSFYNFAFIHSFNKYFPCE